ncbi:reverse transcriptase domain-containing protein [Tanacetum coccineum]
MRCTTNLLFMKLKMPKDLFTARKSVSLLLLSGYEAEVRQLVLGALSVGESAAERARTHIESDIARVRGQDSSRRTPFDGGGAKVSRRLGTVDDASDQVQSEGIALTWWNSHVRTVTNDVAYAMTWTDLKKKMTTKYYPRNEIKKIEAELWNLKVKGTDVVAYNQRFQELALLCDRMFPEETDKIERYVGGMPDLIYSSVVASKPKTMHEAIECD